jgi:SAM-dependent methyltransferase
MDEDSARKSAAAASFGASADGYLGSRTHSEGADLDRLAAWCEGTTRALDVATGAGHTAGALAEAGVGEVIALDASPSMVATSVESFPGIEGVVGDAERLPFADGAFDAVACRIAAHHFPHPEAFVAEVARVVRPGGVFALEDNVAPEDEDLDSFLNRLERIRDSTHVRSYTTSTWHGWLEVAGFAVRETEHLVRRLEAEPWIARVSSLDAADRERVRRFLEDAPEEANEFFEFRYEDGNVRSFGSLKALIRAERSR